MWRSLLCWAGLLAALPGLAGCFLVRPADEVLVPLPLEDAVARVQVWGNTSSEGRFEIVVETPRGTVRNVLWEDWGPAQRASLYLTPRNWLVVLGGGGVSEMIDLAHEGGPRSIPARERPRDGGESWTYLGAVDRNVDRLAFYGPSEQRECVPLYGAGTSPYRRHHQDRSSCSNLGGPSLPEARQTEAEARVVRK